MYKILKILNNVILLIYKIDLFQMEMMICIFGFEEAIKRIGFSIFFNRNQLPWYYHFVFVIKPKKNMLFMMYNKEEGTKKKQGRR